MKTRIPKAHATRMSSGGRAAWFAYAAGVAGMVANAFLITFCAFLAGRPEARTAFGPANDLVGSLSMALTIPVALALAGRPPRRVVRIDRTVGVAAMAFLTAGGPLLVLGTPSLEVEGPIMLAAWMALCGRLFLVNRWSCLSGDLPPRTARVGEFVGAGPLAGGVIAGAGFLLPWMSWGRLALFGAGGFFGFVGFLGIPIWSVLLGRCFADGREEM